MNKKTQNQHECPCQCGCSGEKTNPPNPIGFLDEIGMNTVIKLVTYSRDGVWCCIALFAVAVFTILGQILPRFFVK